MLLNICIYTNQVREDFGKKNDYKNSKRKVL